MSIANTIGTIDDLIEKTQNIINNLDTLFQYLFLEYQTAEVGISDIAEIRYGRGLEASILSFENKFPVYGSLTVGQF